MTNLMMKKVLEAKAMVAHFAGDEMFIPSQYEEMRYEWKAETPSWSTLKKYAKEIGLVAEKVAFEWHSDGSMLAEMSGIAEGTVFYHTCYHFE